MWVTKLFSTKFVFPRKLLRLHLVERKPSRSITFFYDEIKLNFFISFSFERRMRIVFA